ncbi:MAG: thermonuclease family protein [Rhodospirillaceae bacterium]|nr:thermonuclease family protein [Rhodospirillaceae bacterium]MBL6930726.1 thermonuclease family protein [Rhodospirillales bacterium]
MKLFFAIFFALIVLAFDQPSIASTVVVAKHHEITVIDGDSIQIGDTVFQLVGIDAPELGQVCDHEGNLWLCGLAAGSELRKLINLQTMPIKCTIQPQKNALPVATCLIGDSEISDILLKSGFVVAMEESNPHYIAMEDLGKKGSLGIWGSKFIQPRKWRNGERLPNEDRFKGAFHSTNNYPWKMLKEIFLNKSRTDHVSCMVRGKVLEGSDKFYFSPLDAEFESLKMNPKHGDRYFCGDEEARQAGWRRKGEMQKVIK